MKIKALVLVALAVLLSSAAYSQKLTVSYYYTFDQTPYGLMVNYQLPKCKVGFFADYSNKPPTIKGMRTLNQKEYNQITKPVGYTDLKVTDKGVFRYSQINAGISYEVVKNLTFQAGASIYTYRDYIDVTLKETRRFLIGGLEQATKVGFTGAVSYNIKPIRITAGYNSGPNAFFAGLGYTINFKNQ